MGIIGWVVLGLAAGLLANMLIPGRRAQGVAIACAIGVAGAPARGWAAARLPTGPLTLSTRLTAIAGAAVLLLAYLLVTGRADGRMALR
jgi:uncharacterized membrane protein YeaQ/YmgE (transglycosylase-associated protein family)